MPKVESRPSSPPVDAERLSAEGMIPVKGMAQRNGFRVEQLFRAHFVGTLSHPDAAGNRHRVFLEMAKILGRWYTSEAAWGRYLRAMNGEAPPSGAASLGARSPSQRRKAVARANEIAESLGA